MSAALADGGGVLARRDHPGLRTALAWCRRTGELVSVLPGVVATPATAESLEGRVRAASLWCPDAVVVGRAAARLTYWPSLPVDDLELAQVDVRCVAPGFALSGRRVHPDLVTSWRGVRVTTPAATAIDLCDELGGDPVDVVLRSRSAGLADLHRALELTPGRRGNRTRRRLLVESRAEPWSAAERRAHALLHAAGIKGWRANHLVRAGGRPYRPDIAFPGARLVVEIDGRAFHDSAEAFEDDRRRQNDLVAAGWTVLRFTWRMLLDDPEDCVARIKLALR